MVCHVFSGEEFVCKTEVKDDSYVRIGSALSVLSSKLSSRVSVKGQLIRVCVIHKYNVRLCLCVCECKRAIVC